MSRHRTHPVFSVAVGTVGQCGHQHSDPQTALNCLSNVAKRFSSVDRFEVLQYNEEGIGKRVELLTRKPERCTECGQSLVASAKYEFGHADDCPLVSD